MSYGKVTGNLRILSLEPMNSVLVAYCLLFFKYGVSYHFSNSELMNFCALLM
jgi:hypothetical protein